MVVRQTYVLYTLTFENKTHAFCVIIKTWRNLVLKLFKNESLNTCADIYMRRKRGVDDSTG